MSYKYEVVLSIASPNKDNFSEILQEMMNCTVQFPEIAYEIIQNSHKKIIKKEDYSCLNNDEHVLLYVNESINWNESDDRFIKHITHNLIKNKVSFKLQIMTMGYEFNDIKFYEDDYLHKHEKTDDNCTVSFLNDNSMIVSRVIKSDNNILDEFIATQRF